MGKGKLKKAFMYTRITPWMQPQSCLDKRDAIKSFLERNGYAYNQKMGRVVIGTTDENFNDMNSWQFLLQLSEMKPIAKGAECLIVYTLDDLSKSKSVAKEMVDINMKYLTREWYVNARLSYIDGSVRCSKLAERFDESFYKAVYQKRYEKFERNERLRDEFRNPQDDLKRYDDWINEPNISQEEKERRIEHKKITLYLERERFETGKYHQYNEAFTKKMFDVDLKWRLELISHLPDYILSEVADVRVFALGYASKKVKTLLRDYCKHLRREYKKVLGKAQIETNKAESKLPKCIMANEYGELMLQRIYLKDGSVFLVFDSGTLKVINGEIIEQEEKRLYHYKRKEPYSGWSMVLYAEVSYENGLFELHLLIDNKDKKGQSRYWYLTVSGTNIIESRDSKLSYVSNFIKIEYEDEEIWKK